MRNTLRDKIATEAMKTLMLDKELHKLYGTEAKLIKVVAVRSYMVADEMIKIRNQ
jgi:hypothetical protein